MWADIEHEVSLVVNVILGKTDPRHVLPKLTHGI